MRDFEFKYQEKKEKVKILATSRSQYGSTSSLELTFLQNGFLEGFSSYSISGKTITKYKLGPKSWSQNKWTIDESIVDLYARGGKVSTKTNSSYQNVDGVGLPKGLSIKTKQFILQQGKKGPLEKLVNEQESEVLFSNYFINKGIAKRFINGS